VEISTGATIALACKTIEITDQTCHCWQSEYGGLLTDEWLN
jgi:hypothetical protein